MTIPMWDKNKLGKTITVMLLLGLALFGWAQAALAATYTVKPNDTLWGIAQRYGITVNELARTNGISNPSMIYPGQVLSISGKIHTVRPGDTLWLISQWYGVNLQALISANPGINANYIYPGQIIHLPAAGVTEAYASRAGRIYSNYSQGEIDLLARLVHSEASGEPYIGQVAVAASVLNRVASPRYPNTLYGVIYQVTNGNYQYSPVLDGRINLPANQTAYRAVYEALGGWDPSNNALGFYNPRKTSNQWVRQQTVTTVIGNHVFFR